MRERKAAPTPPTDRQSSDSISCITERHFTPNELALMWSMHPSTVRRIFENMPGVLKLSVAGSPGSRRYVTLRIPRSVAETWYRKAST